jgi:hypothetical protein
MRKWRLNRIWTNSKCDSLDCKLRGSDNARVAVSPFIAPMKPEHLKFMILENKQRAGAALLLFLCLTGFVLTPGASQTREQRHVTAIQLGGAAEGSRVTVVSDAALIDYEAFRRGDRFYVKIPLADSSAAAPRFRADGFDDVQVQRVGDSLVISFKLQPGATARVDQRGNRLDVVFSSPNRRSLNSTTSAGSQRIETPQTSGERGRDAAGPMPADTEQSSRARVVAERASALNESRFPGVDRRQGLQSSSKTDANKNSSKGNNQLTPGQSTPGQSTPGQSTLGNVATASPAPLSSPVSSPSSLLSSGSKVYQPLSSATPVAASSPNAGANSAGSTSFLNWRTRQAAALQWMSANRLATLLGALILLSLIVYLLLAVRRRKETVVKTKRANVPKVQPKHSAAEELKEVAPAASHSVASSTPASSTRASNSRPVAVAPESNPRILTRPTIVAPAVVPDEHNREEEEREVFEL